MFLAHGARRDELQHLFNLTSYQPAINIKYKLFHLLQNVSKMETWLINWLLALRVVGIRVHKNFFHALVSPCVERRVPAPAFRETMKLGQGPATHVFPMFLYILRGTHDIPNKKIKETLWPRTMHIVITNTCNDKRRGPVQCIMYACICTIHVHCTCILCMWRPGCCTIGQWIRGISCTQSGNSR